MELRLNRHTNFIMNFTHVDSNRHKICMWQIFIFVQNQTLYHLANENPSQLHHKPLHSMNVAVWYSVPSFSIIGPHFFKDDNVILALTLGHQTHMTQALFTQDLTEFLRSMRTHGLNKTEQWHIWPEIQLIPQTSCFLITSYLKMGTFLAFEAHLI